MKTFKSLPKDNGLPFFERYASLIHSLTRFAVVAQLVCALTEIGIIYALLYPSISDLLPDYASAITTPLSILFASLLQVGLKKVFPFAVRAILYKRFKGLDMPFSIAVFVLSIALLSVSVLLSYKGSHDIIDIAIAPPTEKTTTATDSTKAATERQANATFTTDSATIETKYLGKSEAIQSEFSSRAGDYDAQAARAKGSIYKAELTAKANSIRAELKTKLAVLQSEKATELEAKANERKATINKANDKNESTTALIVQANMEAKGEASRRKSKYKNYIGFFVLFCYVFFLIAFVLDEIHKKGSEINETPVLHQRHFAASLFAEWLEAIKARIDTYFRTKIYAFADKTKASPLPNALNPLYDFDSHTYNVWNIETTEPNEKKVIKIPSKTLRIAAKTDTSKTAKTDEIEAKTSRKIGFFSDKTDDKKTESEPSEMAKTATDVTAAVMHEKPQPKVKNCEWCNNRFEYIVYNKKYCCEDCKKAAWTAKTGINFDLELKKKERQKKILKK